MKNRKQYQLSKKEDGFGKEFYAIPVNDPTERGQYLGSTESDALTQLNELNTKYRMTDYTFDEIKEFWESIDLTPVNEFFSKLLQLSVNMQKALKNGNGGFIFNLQDDTNIASLNPITAAAWKLMVVNSFGCNVNVDKDTGELYFWANIHLAYEHHSGGSNGAEIGSAFFKNGLWAINSSAELAEKRCR